MKEAQPTLPRLDWLDYARFVCAMWVLSHHYLVTFLDPKAGLNISDYGLATKIAVHGSVPLFAFLMMSGMVITMIAQRQSAETFITRRLVRVYPTFLIAMTLTCLIRLLGPEDMHVPLPQYLANLLINAPLFGYKYVGGVYWTLVIELVFYFGVFMVIATGAIRHLQAVVTIWVLLQIAALGLPWRIPLIEANYSFLAAGSVFGLLYEGRNPRLNLLLLALMLPLCIRYAIYHAGFYDGDPVITGAMTVFVFALFLFMRGRNPKLPASARIGSMTYAMYLLHFHIGLIAFQYWINDANKWLVVAGTTLFVIAISFAFDDLVEYRLRPLWEAMAKRIFAPPFVWWREFMASRQVKLDT